MIKRSSSKSQLQTQKPKTSNQKNESVYCNVSRNKSQIQMSGKSRNNKSKMSTQMKEDENNQIRNIKCLQLFSVIQTFYNTLCSLPLESLINSSQPQLWIEEQENTLNELEQKLEKFNKHKEFQYYKWKLHSVTKILSNIHENMSMLQRITHLKGYYSGTDTSNYRSRGSSSIQSDRGSIKLGSFATDKQEVKQLLSYDHYIISQNQMPPKSSKSHPSPQILAETVNSDEQMSDEEEEKPVFKSDVFQKRQQSTRRTAPIEGENKNTMNTERNMCISNFVKTQPKQVELKDKTLAKIQNNKQNPSAKTKNEARFLEDRILSGIECESTEKTNFLKNNSNTIDMSKQECTEQSVTIARDIQKEEYISMIKELRFELFNKDKQLEKLLINEQQFESGMELFRERQKQKNTQILFLKENISNTNKQKEKLQSEMKKLLNYQEELKETIRFERDRNKRDEKEKDKIEEKFYEETQNNQQLIDQINQLKEENKNCKKNERVMKEKLDVYTKKYFTVYKQLQQSKEIEQMLLKELDQMKNRKTKTHSRYDEIKEIVEFHKQKFCDDSF